VWKKLVSSASTRTDSLPLVHIRCISLASQVLLKGSKETEMTGPHNANQTSEWSRRYSWEVMNHTAYSTDLAPSDFHLLRHHEKHLAVKSLQKTPMWSKMSPSGYSSLTPFVICRDTSLHATLEQKFKCKRWLCGELMCTICYTRATQVVYIEVRIMFSAWECLFPYVLSPQSIETNYVRESDELGNAVIV
jgi:hypothetical protein